MILKKGDWILGIILGLFAVCLWYVTLLGRPASEEVIITQGGQVVERLPLHQDVKVNLEGNTITISHGAVTMVHADCPNQICVHQGAITQGGQAIVCAPHEITVSISSSEGLDGVAY